MQSASVQALDFSSTKTRLRAFALIAVLAVLLLVSPVIFFIAILGFAVAFARVLPASIAVDVSLQRFVAWLCANATWVALFVSTIWIASSPSLPPDDLLRHILSAGWNYNYLSHYEHHLLPTAWSWSIGFDALVGQIHALTGDTMNTVRVVRGLETLLVGSLLVLAINRATADPALRFLALTLALVGMVWPRLHLGRPEVLFTGLVFAACTFRRSAWLALFAGMSCAYAFSPIYAAACLLLGSSAEPIVKRLFKNAAVGVAAAASAITVWMIYTGGEYTIVYTLLRTVLQVQTDNKITIGELAPLTSVMASPVALLICFGLLAIVWNRAAYIASNQVARHQILLCLAVALYFSLPNYVRYAAIIWPLFMLAALYAVGDRLPFAAPRSWVWVAGIAFLAINVAPRGTPIEDSVLKTLRVPDGSRVLAPFNSSSYIASSANPKAIVTPIFDMSTVVEPAQGLVRILSEGTLDCNLATSMSFDYLLENSLKGQAPACVEVVAIDGPYRLWRFLK